MSYVKTWATNEKLNKTELKKLEKDGLEIFEDIPAYAKNGFDSIPKEEWDLFKWAGLYLQRPKESGYFMMRVKVPSGVLNYEQIKALAGISKDYGRSIFDITTRQAIQFHWLTIEQIPDILERLQKVGLSTAGACGDITRNIIGNPLAGIDRDELFDTTPVVKEVFDYFERNEDFSNLPRKYKISISASIHNAGHAEINDVAFVPAIKELNGEIVKGFHVKVGGGLSAAPHLAQTLDVFVKKERVKDVAIGITTIFRDFGYREKRHRARLKFLVADWGVEKFKEKLLEYTGPLPEKGEEQTKDWNAGYFYGVHPQKQEGLNYIGFNVPVGRLDADEVFEIAEISKKYGNGEIRTCNSQNFIIPNVPNENVEALLNEKIFERITINPPKFTAYSVSCTGIEFCNLALVETKEKMRRVAEYLDKHVAIDVPVRIHMTGCPNSCGQRQIADIGVQGIKMKSKDKRMVEAFEIYVGGTLHDGGKFNEKLKGKVESSHLEPVLKDLLTYVAATKLPGESFYDYVNRVGIAPLQTELDHILGNLVESVSY
ncbi:nitrite/sulfite reductase [Fictibacillus gelatini]|uniref:nitrite/sulfite reductase n=1 Tax=Fictibacillus gelatini TaxID=225985 RepID=UPI00040D12C5|nr:ferredoxin--nitrite reductase [Fictibacillus gelatini]